MQDDHNDMDSFSGDFSLFKDGHVDMPCIIDYGGPESERHYDGADLYHSPEELMAHFAEGLNCDFDADRKALRRYAPQMQSFFYGFFERWFSQRTWEIESVDLMNFLAMCYFAAETHFTALYDCILGWLHPFSEHDITYLGDFTLQHLPSVLYSCYDGDIEKTISFLEEPAIAESLRIAICKALVQLDLDGIFSPRKHVNLIRRAIKVFADHKCEATTLAEWIVLTDEGVNMRTELQEPLNTYVDPMMYGIVDAREFCQEVKRMKKGEYIQRDLVMDDAIYVGVLPNEIHPPKGLRKQVLKEQVLRLQQMR